jgi:hypothetical protein
MPIPKAPVESQTSGNYSITPSPELVREWATTNGTSYEDLSALCQNIATRAAQWGADQELEACCEWVKSKQTYWAHDELRATRRPKPPSLKEQALKALHSASFQPGTDFRQIDPVRSSVIRRALEQLDD